MTDEPTLDPYADPTRHILEVTDGRWSIRHPHNCHPDFPCKVQSLADKSPHLATLHIGRYECWDHGPDVDYLMVGREVQ